VSGHGGAVWSGGVARQTTGTSASIVPFVVSVVELLSCDDNALLVMKGIWTLGGFQWKKMFWDLFDV